MPASHCTQEKQTKRWYICILKPKTILKSQKEWPYLKWLKENFLLLASLLTCSQRTFSEIEMNGTVVLTSKWSLIFYFSGHHIWIWQRLSHKPLYGISIISITQRSTYKFLNIFTHHAVFQQTHWNQNIRSHKKRITLLSSFFTMVCINTGICQGSWIDRLLPQKFLFFSLFYFSFCLGYAKLISEDIKVTNKLDLCI